MRHVRHTCTSTQRPIDASNRFDRREFLWRYGGGLGGIALAHLLGQHGLLATDAPPSTQPPMWGTRSLTHLPLWPYCFHAQGLCIHVPGSLWNSSTFSPVSNRSP